mmetsp:Transcript_34856/g.56866  ORF Transcript_34856/g.56866 Transcript_34856/m.56866 type:complete len:306 (-) Transcript_34856:214-1131(-)
MLEDKLDHQRIVFRWMPPLWQLTARARLIALRFDHTIQFGQRGLVNVLHFAQVRPHLCTMPHFVGQIHRQLMIDNAVGFLNAEIFLDIRLRQHVQIGLLDATPIVVGYHGRQRRRRTSVHRRRRRRRRGCLCRHNNIVIFILVIDGIHRRWHVRTIVLLFHDTLLLRLFRKMRQDRWLLVLHHHTNVVHALRDSRVATCTTRTRQFLLRHLFDIGKHAHRFRVHVVENVAVDLIEGDHTAHTFARREGGKMLRHHRVTEEHVQHGENLAFDQVWKFDFLFLHSFHFWFPLHIHHWWRYCCCSRRR